jgi:hypothetical protein
MDLPWIEVVIHMTCTGLTGGCEAGPKDLAGGTAENKEEAPGHRVWLVVLGDGAGVHGNGSAAEREVEDD